MERVGENIRDLINDQTDETINAEIKGLRGSI